MMQPRTETSRTPPRAAARSRCRSPAGVPLARVPHHPPGVRGVQSAAIVRRRTRPIRGRARRPDLPAEERAHLHRRLRDPVLRVAGGRSRPARGLPRELEVPLSRPVYPPRTVAMGRAGRVARHRRCPSRPLPSRSAAGCAARRRPQRTDRRPRRHSPALPGQRVQRRATLGQPRSQPALQRRLQEGAAQ